LTIAVAAFAKPVEDVEEYTVPTTESAIFSDDPEATTPLIIKDLELNELRVILL
jgi:hypothetical protein